MNSGKSCGPYSISTKLLKSCPITFSHILSILVNKSFAEGTFPDFLKIAEVITIYKKKDKTLCENYRPISLLSNISKIYERAYPGGVLPLMTDTYVQTKVFPADPLLPHFYSKNKTKNPLLQAKMPKFSPAAPTSAGIAQICIPTCRAF